MQSAAVSPPPITATCLPAALMVGSAGGAAGWSCGGARCGAEPVLLGEVVHGRVYASQVGAGDLEGTFPQCSDGEHHCIVLVADGVNADVAAHLGVTAKPHALLLEDLDASVDHPFLELEVGHSEAHKAADGFAALVHGHGVAEGVQLGGGGHAGWS